MRPTSWFVRVGRATSRATARLTAFFLAGAHNAPLDLEELPDRELERVQASYSRLAKEARSEPGRGVPDTGVPEVR